ncbi:TetR family transcriptional regulator [Cellulomonas sp. APG4]|uniref:TetR/AcrR family transcriptional regulator n=1 Tax=Cellulomonas sp. APG4 TaxID=1538656 RepID=UPI00137AFAD1|nr:TetR family transcriptional regulator [Cellulomonas sp. APG4]
MQGTEEAAPAEPEVALGLRERQKRARRDALVDAAHALVEADGLEAVTVDAICRRAGVSTRTFFNYFESKDDAVLGLPPWRLDDEATRVFAAGGPTGRLGADVTTLVQSLVDRHPVARHRIACAMELAEREPALLTRQVAAFHRHHLEVAQLVATRLGAAVGDPQVEAATALVLALVRASFVEWFAGDEERPVSELVPGVVTRLRDLLAD